MEKERPEKENRYEFRPTRRGPRGDELRENPTRWRHGTGRDEREQGEERHLSAEKSYIRKSDAISRRRGTRRKSEDRTDSGKATKKKQCNWETQIFRGHAKIFKRLNKG